MHIINAITFDFTRVDSNAITIFIIGFGVVFSALTIIYLFFAFFPKLLKVNLKKKDKETVKSENKSLNIIDNAESEVFAAIAMALSLHFEDVHDEESMILTINLNERLNSQWNSKIQNIDIYKN
ncbi:MAG TPA: OadG family protein [Bacteroidales bacterium]|nr:OadG family protein [Bacteroidales bacterium]